MTSRAAVAFLVGGMLCVGRIASGCVEPDRETCSPSVVEMMWSGSSNGEFFGGTGDLRFDLVLRDRRRGVFIVESTVLRDDGLTPSHEIGRFPLEGNGSLSISVSVADLELPNAVLGAVALVNVTGRVVFDDGTTEPMSPAVDLVLERRGEGWWVESGAAFETRLLRAAAEGLPVPPVPASARKVSESTEWRPPEDDPVPTGVVGTKVSGSRSGVKICVRQASVFVDAGVGEDFWQSNTSTDRASRGFHVTVSREGTSLWTGYLGDGRGTGDPGSGCTPVLSDPPNPGGTYSYEIRIDTEAMVQSNLLDSAYYGNGTLHWTFTRSLTGTGTFDVVFDPTNLTGKVFDVAMVGAYCLYRHSGGLSGEYLRFRLTEGSPDSWVNRYDNMIRIGDQRADRKFIIAHETGHIVGDLATGDHNWKTVDTRCQCYNSTSCPSEHGSHTMISKERSRCAVAEGFAHFYSAAVFNSHTDDSPQECWFHYYKEVDGDWTPVVNCELDYPDGPFDEKYMETNCAVPWIGMGTELDWMRTFWDVLSDQTVPLTMDDILQWIDRADYWHNYFAYNELDEAADEIGGDLDFKWDIAKERNGVDWSGYSRLFLDGFETGDANCWDD